MKIIRILLWINLCYITYYLYNIRTKYLSLIFTRFLEDNDEKWIGKTLFF